MLDALASNPSIRQLGVVAHTCKPSTWKVRAGRTEVQLPESLSQRRKYWGFAALGPEVWKRGRFTGGLLEKGLPLEINSSKDLAGR